MPVGYWAVVVVDDVQGAAGYHLDANGQPYALVEHSDSWSLTASHETVEMVVDPWGMRIAPGRSPKRDQGQVEFLVEACDPCAAAEFAYTINGVLVSDFITPQFYDPRKTVAARYSFTGAVARPRQILRGGYISWHEPHSNQIWQQLWLGAEKEFKDLGEGDARQGSLRGFVDEHTDHPGQRLGLTGHGTFAGWIGDDVLCPTTTRRSPTRASGGWGPTPRPRRAARASRRRSTGCSAEPTSSTPPPLRLGRDAYRLRARGLRAARADHVRALAVAAAGRRPR